VQGVYAGDPEELVVGAAFPTLWQRVAEHGSLLRGLRAARKEAAGTSQPSSPAGLVAARGGFGRMCEALAEGLSVKLGTRAVALSANPTPEEGYRVELWDEAGAHTTLATRQLVLALPAAQTAALLAPWIDTSPIASLPHAPVAVVALGFERSRVLHPLDGFGFLAPGTEGRQILGCLFSSTLFPDRAPAGRCLLTVMVGGRRQAETVELEDSALVQLAQREVAALLGIEGEPEMAAVVRWQPGIPQPTAAWAAAGHCARQLEERQPGLTLLGSWRYGVGVPDCVRAGWEAGRHLKHDPAWDEG
jgi:oxygen-dependent protoporphyrinogen oxidase